MHKLIADLVAATEGSRELDNKIFLATHPRQGTTSEDGEYWFAAHMDIDGGPWILLPNYSHTLDAALGLVLEGWVWHIQIDYDLPGRANLYNVMPGSVYDPPERVSADGATPALALCIAALKARQIGESENGK